MALKKAVIIAIQEYAKAEDLGPTLPNTIEAGERFYEWLTRVKGLNSSDVTICADQGNFGGHKRLGTDRSSIIDGAITQLIDTWRDKDPAELEAFLFFSGHGLGFQQSLGKRAVDALVCSNYINRKKSGGACIQLGELQEKMYFSLGGAHHYFFIDACRTIMGSDEIDVPSFGTTYASAKLGNPTRYTIFSTAYGEVAATNSGFSPTLVEGLKGKGHAKGWVGTNMYVTFDLLQQYLRSKLTQQIDPKREGPGDGFILQLSPIPQSQCQVEVRNSDPQDQFELVASWQGLRTTQAFQGSTATLKLAPNYYDLTLLHQGLEVVRLVPIAGRPVDFYEDCQAIYDKTACPPKGAGLKGPVEEAVGRLHVIAPTGGEVRLRNLTTGESRRSAGPLELRTRPGVYQVKVLEAGEPISRGILNIAAGQSTTFDAVKSAASQVRSGILNAVSDIPNAVIADLSETLGPMANSDLSLWLALIGAAHILAPKGKYHKIARLPLETFSDVPPGSAVVYLLAAFESEAEPPWVATSKGTQLAWTQVQSLGGIPNLYQLKLPLASGPVFVSCRHGKTPPVTYASHALPNRATLVVLVEDGTGSRTVQQYLLPIYHLRNHLPVEVAARLDDWRLLRWMRYMSAFQRRFSEKRAVAPMADSDQEERIAWEEVLSTKWIDPAISLIAAYEMIRRGLATSGASQLEVVVNNLRQYFPGVADAEAIASAIGLPHSTPANPPILLQGVMLLTGVDRNAPFPAEKLNFDSMWTSWKSAVS